MFVCNYQLKSKFTTIFGFCALTPSLLKLPYGCLKWLKNSILQPGKGSISYNTWMNEWWTRISLLLTQITNDYYFWIIFSLSSPIKFLFLDFYSFIRNHMRVRNYISKIVYPSFYKLTINNKQFMMIWKWRKGIVICFLSLSLYFFIAIPVFRRRKK